MVNYFLEKSIHRRAFLLQLVRSGSGLNIKIKNPFRYQNYNKVLIPQLYWHLFRKKKLRIHFSGQIRIRIQSVFQGRIRFHLTVKVWIRINFTLTLLLCAMKHAIVIIKTSHLQIFFLSTQEKAEKSKSVHCTLYSFILTKTSSSSVTFFA